MIPSGEFQPFWIAGLPGEKQTSFLFFFAKQMSNVKPCLVGLRMRNLCPVVIEIVMRYPEKHAVNGMTVAGC